MEARNAINPAIVFEPDGYRTDGERLMGRQAAGNGFLRAAVAASAGRPLVGYTSRKLSAQVFAKTVEEIDPAAKAQWLVPGRTDLLAQIGHLYTPGPTLADLARQRLRTGPQAWSITGVTHTTASHMAMDSIADLAVAPVMPWDALVCTSNAVAATVKVVLEAQRDYLRWRFGAQLAMTLPQLPVIPLGVHCSDFAIDPQTRQQARQDLQIAQDDVVALFVGRLSFHAKAHPHAMYAGLEAAAKVTGRKLVLIQCGWFANGTIENSFRQGAASACPSVRCVFTDGRQSPSRSNSWAAADLFISLSDNVQETFGLSPIEAMAAGLPVVVTDWDGYKDTVRDGIDGFRIPTWMSPAGTGEPLAAGYELGIDTYDMYCGLTCQHVSLDHRALAERLTALVSDPALRRRLGEAGQQRAREALDWSVVYRRYQDLWHELERLRGGGAPVGKAPRAAPARLDPFVAFGYYPTAQIAPTTKLKLCSHATRERYRLLAGDPLFSYASKVLPSDEGIARVWPALSAGPTTVTEAARSAGMEAETALRTVAVLAKMGLVELSGPA